MRTLASRVFSLLCAVLIAVALLLYQLGQPAKPEVMRLADGTEIQVQMGIINFVIQIGIMIISALLTYALAPKPQPPKPATITDFDVPTAEEGREIPVIFGEVWITGPNVLWYGDLRNTPIKKKAKKK